MSTVVNTVIHLLFCLETGKLSRRSKDMKRSVSGGQGRGYSRVLPLVAMTAGVTLRCCIEDDHTPCFYLLDSYK